MLPYTLLWIFVEYFCTIKMSQPRLMRSKNVQCCGSGMVMQDPNPDPGSKIFPDPHPDQRILSIFNPKLFGNMIQNVHPGSGSWLFTHPGIPDLGGQKGTGSRIRIRNTGHFILLILFSSQIHRDWPLASWEDGAPCRTAGSLPAPHQVRYTDMFLTAFRIRWIRTVFNCSPGFLLTCYTWSLSSDNPIRIS